MSDRYNANIGVHANAWSGPAATGPGGFSAALDTFSSTFVTGFGHVDGATTITMQYSQDNTNFYDGPNTVLAGAADFRIDANCGARFVRLKSSNNVNATATLAAKP